MGIFSDKIMQSLGLPTKKEVLDKKIDDYRLHEKNSIEHSKAIRTQGISYLNEQIRQLEKVIEDNQLFINYHETIKMNATEKIKLGDNPEKVKILDSSGKILINANYKTIEDYFDSVIKKSTNLELIKQLNYILSVAYERTWQGYAKKIIEGKGIYYYNNQPLDECYDIYGVYNKALSFMNAGHLRDENKKTIIFKERNIQLITKTYNFCEKTNNLLMPVLSELKSKLDNLNFTQASDEYTLKTIEEAKTILFTSKEYFNAKKSHEFLEEFKRL